MAEGRARCPVLASYLVPLPHLTADPGVSPALRQQEACEFFLGSQSSDVRPYIPSTQAQGRPPPMEPMSQFQTGGVEKLDSFIDEGQVRGRDKTRAQALCFSSGLVGANFSWSFFHTLLSIS